MRLLVFGATGQVATEIGRRHGDRHSVRLLSRSEADLSDPRACASAVTDSDADAVINAAAYTAVDRAESEEALATTINAAAPAAMAEAAARRGIPFVHLSTDYVFDGSGAEPRGPDAPTGPLGVYGRSKLAGERAVVLAGGRSVILRTSWVFAAHGRNFVRTMLTLGETRDRLRVVADQVGGPTPATAIADACVDIAGQLAGGADGGIHHFAGTPDTSWADFARAVFAISGQAVTVEDIPSEAYPTPAPRPRNSRLDCASLAREFGIARPDWRAALPDVVAILQRELRA